MTMIRLIVPAVMFLALGGCVVPFGISTGPGDNRTPYFANDGNAIPSEQLNSGPYDPAE